MGGTARPGLGGDPERLVLVGDSAGGNIAVNAAYLAASGTLESSCKGRVPAVRAVVGLYAVLDPVGLHHDGRAPEAPMFAEQYIGGTPRHFRRATGR